jgi:hypothetical protein
MSTERPAPWVSSAVRTATLLLPRGSARDRYRQELSAELYAMPRAEQRRFAAGVLTSAYALRRAVSGQAEIREERAMKLKPVRCRLNVHHHWKSFSTEDGGQYERCLRCGKDRTDNAGGGRGGWAAAIGLR